MQDSYSVITTAVEGYGKKLASLYGISIGRLYQILEQDFYGKTKRLIRMIALLDIGRAKLIKADLDAFFCEIFAGEDAAEVNCADLHKELTDVIQAKLSGKPRDEQLREAREAVALLSKQIAELDKEQIRIDHGFSERRNFAGFTN